MATPNTITTTILHRIQSSDPSLTKLKLVKPPSAYYVDFGDFVLALQQNSCIQHVVLYGDYLRKLTDEEYTELLHAVASIQNLQSLRLNRVTSARCVGLVTAITRNRRSSLEKLILNYNNLGDGVADSLAMLLGTTGLKHIELNHTNLTDRSCVSMAQALETNTFLETLTLFGNKIGDESYLAFAGALTHNSTLKLIDLESDRPRLTVVGAKSLLEMVEKNFVIEHICTPVTVRSYKWTGELLSIGNQIRRFLRLNRFGRKRLVQGPSSRRDWLETIAKVGDDLDAVHYLVRANPFLCDRYQCDSSTASSRKRKAEPEAD